MNSYRWHSTKLMHGTRRTAVELVEKQLETSVAQMNWFLDRKDWANVILAYDAVKTLRAEYENLFTCSIHEIEGVDNAANRDDYQGP